MKKNNNKKQRSMTCHKNTVSWTSDNQQLVTRTLSGRRVTVDKFFITVIAFITVFTAKRRTTGSNLQGTRTYLVHIPVTIVFERVKNFLTVWFDQVSKCFPQWMRNVVNESNLCISQNTLRQTRPTAVQSSSSTGFTTA